jgi:hypothetical protein
MHSKSIIFVIVLLIIGCESSIDNKQVYLPPNIQDSTQITDENVLRAVYSSYKYPAGFYQEDLNGGSPYYENTISTKSISERPSYWYELSTNNRDQAFAWSESSSVYSAYYRKLESEKETEKYFEFRRVWEEHPTDILLSRVHKEGYLDKSMYDRLNPGDTLGIFTKSNIDTTSVRELIEYLWFVWNYNMGGAKALCSYVINFNDSVNYLLFYTMVSYGDWGLCDQISVMRSIFSVSKQSGIIKENKYLVRHITGKCN